jgi:ABC-2 type transport system permease protein
MRALSTIFWLSLKEVRSFLGDWVLLGLVIYSFSLAIIAQAQSNSQELSNASLGVVDEDGSELSRRIVAAFLPPYFKPAQAVPQRDVDRLMNTGRYTFILDIPPHFQRDVLAGRKPVLQVLVDATAMMQAGIGASYAQQDRRRRGRRLRAPRAPDRSRGRPRGAHRLQSQRDDGVVYSVRTAR